MHRRWRRLIGLAVFGVVAGGGWWAWRWRDTSPLRAAEAAYQRKDWRAAYAGALAYRRTHPREARAAALAAAALAQMGDCEGAAELLDQVAQPAADDLRLVAACWTSRGLQARDHRAFASAAAAYHRLLERAPADADALKQSAALLIQLDRPAEAIEFCRRLTAIPSQAKHGHYMLGTIYAGQGQHAEACDHLTQSLDRAPELTEAPDVFLRLLARSLLRLGRAAEAERHLDRALEIRRDAEGLWLLGHARQQQGAGEAAIECWKSALAEDPRFLPALEDLGELQLALGRPAEAIPWLERAVEIDALDATLYYRLGTALRQLGRWAEADARLAEAKRLRGE